MTEREKHVWGWLIAGFVVMAICVMGYVYSLDDTSDWSAAKNANTAKSYREFYSRHRTSEFADEALSQWELALWNLREKLDLLDCQAVDAFLKDYPEFDDEEVREAQYQAVVSDGSYDLLQRYCHASSTDVARREKVDAMIDKMVMAEVRKAKSLDDFFRLSWIYSNWRGCQKNIMPHIKRLKLEEAGRVWEQVKGSRDENELRKFMKRFDGTTYVRQAEERINALWSDLDYVREKNGTLSGYVGFVQNHPNSPRVREAWRLIEDELADYVFKRKAMKGEERRVKSLLADYVTERPLSGVVVCEPRHQPTSPLQITTDWNSGDYYVKLVETRTKQVVGIYVRGSSTIEVEVPDGTYSVRYATGSKWHGVRFLFGLDAHYSRADNLFTFSRGSGYSLTLKRVVNGNLHTKAMPAQDF